MSSIALTVRFTPTTKIRSRLPSPLRNPTTFSMIVPLALPRRRFQTFASLIAHPSMRPFCVPAATGSYSFSDLPGDELSDFSDATVATGPLTTGPGGSEPDWDESDLSAATAATGLTGPGFSEPADLPDGDKSDVAAATGYVTSRPNLVLDKTKNRMNLRLDEMKNGLDEMKNRMEKQMLELEKRQQESLGTRLVRVEDYFRVELYDQHIRKWMGDDVDEDLKARVIADLVERHKRFEEEMQMDKEADELKTQQSLDSGDRNRSLRDAGKDDAAKKVRLMCSYCKKHEETEVPDPYYGGAKGFEKGEKIILNSSRMQLPT